MPLPSPMPAAARFDLPGDRSGAEAFFQGMGELLQRFGYPEASKFAVRLALEEAISNAFKHGHKNLPPSTPVHVDYEIGPRSLRVRIEDQGPGFDPAGVPDPTLDENIELPSGRGLMLMGAYMTSLRYLGRGNQVELVYEKPAAS
jgi:serine/threonine-protein kinase RsbW